MMVPALTTIVMVAVVAISATLGLERSLDVREVRAKTTEHMLDHVVRPNTENLIANFSRQMPISEVPGQPHKLVGIFVPNFDNMLGSRLNHQPSPIFELQTIPIRHRNCFRKIEKNNFAFVSSQAKAAAMARIKIEGQSACSVFFWPVACGAMN